MTSEQEFDQESWSILAGFGVLGIIGVLLLIFAAGVVFWSLRMLNKHGEGTILSIKNAFDSVPGIRESVDANTMSSNALAELVKTSSLSNESMLKIIQAQFDPNGEKYVHHVFSSDRLERAWLESLAILEFWADRAVDQELKTMILSSASRMRHIFEKRLKGRGKQSER